MKACTTASPLALMELSNIAPGYIDRYMLKWLIDDFAVIGIYSVGFALASCIDPAHQH